MSEFEEFAAKVTGGTSLDDLLRANKQKFDDVFQIQMRGIPSPEAPAETPAETPAGAAPEDVAPTEQAELAKPELSASEIKALPVPVSVPVSVPVPVERTSPKRSASAAVVPVGATIGQGPAAAYILDAALHGACEEMLRLYQRSCLRSAPNVAGGVTAAVADAEGQVLSASAPAVLKPILQAVAGTPVPGDVYLTNDPWLSEGASPSPAHWLLAVPAFVAERCVGWAMMGADMDDAGGALPGVVQSAVLSVFAEGTAIPPIKLYAGGTPNPALMALFRNNTREPALLETRLHAMVHACEGACQRLQALYARFGAGNFERAVATHLKLSEQRVQHWVMSQLPEEPQSFQDQIDDDGLGRGPIVLKVTLWREGSDVFIDWTGTSATAAGPVNYPVNRELMKSQFIQLLARESGDPGRVNHAYFDRIHVTLPQESVLRPRRGAPLSAGQHTQARVIDVLSGCLVQAGAIAPIAAGNGGTARLSYYARGTPANTFHVAVVLPGGLPASAESDGLDGQFFWPGIVSENVEAMERQDRLRVESVKARMGSGGAGLHRGGNGVEITYLCLAPGYISLVDDRHASQAWGAAGGAAGAPAEHWRIDPEGNKQPLPAKCAALPVAAGTRLVLCTAGGGGCGDPLSRSPGDVQQDVEDRIIGREDAEQSYGVILAPEDLRLDERATDEARARLKRSKRNPRGFDFGNTKTGTAVPDEGEL